MVIDFHTHAFPDKLAPRAIASLVEGCGGIYPPCSDGTVSGLIKNMDDFAKVNEVYAKYFTSQFPARSCVEVARLPKDVLIEIEAIGIKG